MKYVLPSFITLTMLTCSGLAALSISEIEVTSIDCEGNQNTIKLLHLPDSHW